MTGFDQFIKEREYLHNVSPRTLEWYKSSLRCLPCETPTQAQLDDVVIRMRQRGRKPTGVNCVGRAVNAYLRWSGSSCKIRLLKEAQCVLPTFSDPQVRMLLSWRPQTKEQKRLHLILMLLLDTGARISEALTLRVRDVDLNNLLMTVTGKGRKQRIVPFSLELRKAVFRYIGEFCRKPDALLLACRSETQLSRRNVMRDVKNLCRSLGFEPPVRTLHAFRHTFAVNYLRRGGSVFHLQKMLGHSTLEMTRRYANLSTADLQAVHERLSLLSRNG
jgi:integrase/recombinase XerD